MVLSKLASANATTELIIIDKIITKRFIFVPPIFNLICKNNTFYLKEKIEAKL